MPASEHSWSLLESKQELIFWQVYLQCIGHHRWNHWHYHVSLWIIARKHTHTHTLAIYFQSAKPLNTKQLRSHRPLRGVQFQLFLPPRRAVTLSFDPAAQPHASNTFSSEDRFNIVPNHPVFHGNSHVYTHTHTHAHTPKAIHLLAELPSVARVSNLERWQSPQERWQSLLQTVYHPFLLLWKLLLNYTWMIGGLIGLKQECLKGWPFSFF